MGIIFSEGRLMGVITYRLLLMLTGALLAYFVFAFVALQMTALFMLLFQMSTLLFYQVILMFSCHWRSPQICVTPPVWLISTSVRSFPWI